MSNTAPEVKSITKKLSAAFFILAIVVFGTLYSIHGLNKKIGSLQSELEAMPKVAVLDMDALLTQRMKNGEDAATSIRYSKLLAAAALEEGYILLEANNILAMPESAKVPEAPAEQLEAFLKDRGVTIEPIEYFQQKIKTEQEKNIDVLERILGN